MAMLPEGHTVIRAFIYFPVNCHYKGTLEPFRKVCGRLNNIHPHPGPWNLWVLPYMAKGLCRCANKLRIKKGKGLRRKIANIKTVTRM